MTCMPWTPIGRSRSPAAISSVTSTSAIRLLRVASSPTKSMPAARRTTLRPPSAPTRYCARSGFPCAASTSTPLSSWAKPVTSTPRWIGTPSSSTQPSRIRSMWFWKRASECGYRVGKSLRSSIVPPKPTACAIRPSARNRPAIPRWSRISSVREWNPPAREPTSSGRRTPLEDRHLDPRQRQLSREHHAGRPASDDEYVVHQNPVLVGATEQCGA